jgi:hypothetical protein
MPFVLVVAAAGTALAWLLIGLGRGGPRSTDAFAEGLERASRELGIRFEPRSRHSYTARGTIADSTIRVSLTSGPKHEFTDYPPRPLDDETVPYLEVSVAGPRIPRGLRFAAESGRGEDILTGDSVFDELVEVHGEPSLVLALCDKELRQKVAVFVGNGGRLEAEQLNYRTRLQLSQAEIPAALRLTVGMANELSFSDGGGICQRLARNALSDPLPGVRLLNLLQLHDGFPGTGEARDASRAALADSSPWVRLSAARFLGDEGLTVLEDLARDRQIFDQAAVEAVALLAARLPVDRAGPLLVDVLESRAGDAHRQAVEELGRLRYAPALGPLMVVLERADPRNAAVAAAALGSLGDARAESSLLKSLWGEAHEVRFAAARALGGLGSVRSVPPLLTLLDSGRLDAAGRQCVREAVASIQSRLVGAGAGQLSVAANAPESGRLSLAKPRSGAGDLSRVPED